MWPSNRFTNSSYHYYNRDVSSYDPNNHQPLTTQSQGYQQSHQASGWGQAAQDGLIPSPAMHNSSIGTSSHGFGSSGPPRYYNEHCMDRNVVPNQGSGHVPHQGSWHPDNSSSKALPSPVFQNEPSIPTSSYDGGRFNMYCDRGFSNNLHHNQTQGPQTPMGGYQPLQFTPPNHRPNFLEPREQESGLPNHRGGRGARGQTGARNGNGAGRGRGRNKMPQPSKSHGKSKEINHSLSHACDTCERWFKNEEELAKHISEHRTCGIDGCKLTAHSVIVEKHIKMQHDTGLFLKMKDLVNSNDFAKWRAERKLRYPSKENIAKRQEEQAEKVKRGETIGNESGRFPKPRGANFKRNQRREKSKNFREIREGVNHNPAQVKPQDNLNSNTFLDTKKGDKSSKSNVAINAKMLFSHSIDEEQIQDNLVKEERAFSDTEWEPQLETSGSKSAAEVPKLSAALNTLASMYNSDSGDDSEKGSLKSIKIENLTADQIDESSIGGADLPIEVPICREAHEKEDLGDVECPRKASNKRTNQRHKQMEEKSKQQKMNHCDKNINRYKRKQDVSLLQKLLAGEIRHERNVVLQCIRYIVENNFLAVTTEEKSQKIDCGPEMTVCETEMNLSLPVDVTTIV